MKLSDELSFESLCLFRYIFLNIFWEKEGNEQPLPQIQASLKLTDVDSHLCLHSLPILYLEDLSVGINIYTPAKINTVEMLICCGIVLEGWASKERFSFFLSLVCVKIQEVGVLIL